MSKIVSFDTLEEALKYAAKELHVPLTSFGDAGMKATASEMPGINLLKATQSIRQKAGDIAGIGNTPPPPTDAMPIEGLGHLGEPVIPGPSVALGRSIAPRKSTFLRLEEQTKIPVWSQLYQPMEAALLKKRVFVQPWIERIDALTKGMSPKIRSGYAHALQVGELTNAEEKMIKEFGLDSKKLKGIREFFDDLFVQIGAGDARPYFQQMVPAIQVAGKVSKAYPKKNLAPQQIAFFKRYIDLGHIPLWKQDLDVQQLMYSHLHNGAFQRFAGKVWEDARVLWDGRLKDPNVSSGIAGLVTNYLDDIMGKTTPADAMILQAIGKSIHMLKGVGGESVSREEAMHAARRLFGWMWTLNYSANLGLRPAAVGRQFLQTAESTVPIFGARAVFGKGGGVERLATKEGLDLVTRAGIQVEEAPLTSIEEGIKPIWGKIFRRADNVQRAIAGLAQDFLFLKHIPTYTKGGNWERFVDKAELDWYHPLIQNEIKGLIDAGKITDARMRLMQEASESTQWIYRRGNQPEFFRGLGGRVFGQYGVWPTYYLDYLTNMLTRGPLKKRISRTARWMAVNAALSKTFRYTLGASAASWLWFQPVSFSGGPYFQILSDAYTAAGGRGPEADLARSRLKRAPGQVIPGSQAARDLFDVYKELEKGDTQGAIRELMGYPAEKKSKF